MSFKFNGSGSDDAFDAPYVAVNMLGTGLAMFVALQWQMMFNQAIDVWNESPEERKAKGAVGSRLWKPFVVASGSTVLAVILAFMMFKAYNLQKNVKLPSLFAKSS